MDLDTELRIIDAIQTHGLRSLAMFRSVLEALPGADVRATVWDLCELAKSIQDTFSIDFNGISITAGPDDKPQDVLDKWNSASHARNMAYAMDPKREVERAERERAKQELLRTQAAMLAESPDSMALKDPDAWAKWVNANTDDYGAATLRYAERWARLMEGELAKGQPIATSADRMSDIADSEGVSGYMHGVATSVLCQVWAHGDDLRHWREAGR